MHAWILGVALVTAGTLAFAADDAADPQAGCPAVGAAVTERFISADCERCWTDATTPIARTQWLLDWIVPSARGDEAALSSAAPAEAAARARRTLKGALPSDRAVAQRAGARPGGVIALRVTSGPAWSGYFAVQVDGQNRAAAAGAVWVALVESLPAGTEGSAVARELVRTVSGPFTPSELRSGGKWQLLQAMRWPETAQPVRLRARAWIEAADGRIAAMAGERCAGP